MLFPSWLSSITFFEGPSFLGLVTICIAQIDQCPLVLYGSRQAQKWTIFNGWTKWKSWKFSFSRNARIRKAGIEQATIATRCLGTNSPEPRRRAVTEWHVITQKTSSYITVCTWLPGLIVGPCPSKESLCCPACPPPPPFFCRFSAWSLKLCVSFRCICSPPVCIIRSVTLLSLATTTWTPEHPFFWTHCYPNTSSDITCVLGGGSFPVTAHGFSSKKGCCCQGKEVVPVDHIRGKSFLWVEN